MLLLFMPIRQAGYTVVETKKKKKALFLELPSPKMLKLPVPPLSHSPLPICQKILTKHV